MRHIFHSGNPVMVILAQLTDLLLVNVLWLLCCIPIVTIVPASIALYHVVFHMLQGTEGTIAKSFLHR